MRSSGQLPAYVEVLQGSPDRPCPAGADEAVGVSKNLSFDEAFADAFSNLPPLQGADVLSRVQVVEINGLFGGFAGFNDLFIRICRTHD